MSAQELRPTPREQGGTGERIDAQQRIAGERRRTDAGRRGGRVERRLDLPLMRAKRRLVIERLAGEDGARLFLIDRELPPKVDERTRRSAGRRCFAGKIVA
jgi:hypothetical protein